MIPPPVRFVRKDPDPAPVGWYTMRDLAASWNLSIPRTSVIVNEALRNGSCQTQFFRVLSRNRILPIPHYNFQAIP